MLADSESIGIDETSILDTGRAVALGLDLVESSLTAEPQASGEDTFCI